MKSKKINSILVSEGSCYRETRQHQKERGFYKMSKWLDNAIFYEIYPQSFKDTNGDGIGDFQGIIEKLDISENLDVTLYGSILVFSLRSEMQDTMLQITVV